MLRKNEKKRNAKGNEILQKRKQKTWKRHKEFVLINKKSFTFLTRKLRGKYVKK